MHYISGQASTSNSKAAPGWISESTGVARSLSALYSSRWGLKKIVVGYVLNFPKCVLGVVGCSNSHSAFSQARWARKSTWFRAESLRSLTGRIPKNFWIFQKSHNNTQEARVCAWSAVSSPKLTSSFELRLFSTVSPRCRRAVPLFTEMHCFPRLFQDCGPLERASKLKISATT